MRIAIGAFAHEANCFTPHTTDWADFERAGLRRGDEVLEDWETYRSEISGAMSALSGQPGLDVAPLLAAHALPAAPIRESTYVALRDETIARLRAALPVDGVLLALHGSMLAEVTHDATGDLLAHVREVVGPGVPIAGTLDLHANVTERMMRSADLLVGYHTTPHVDQFETGATAARLLLATLRGEIAPTMALVRLPWISSSENCTHLWGPLAEVLGEVADLERRGAALHAAVYPVHAWLDTEDVASSVVVVTDGDSASAEMHADALARTFWARRAEYVPQRVDPDEAVCRAMARDGGTVILCDSADSTTSGGTGDSTTILAACLRAAPLPKVALLNVVDAEVVAQAIAAGVGATVDVRAGGKVGTAFHRPVPLRGRVRLLSDGVFVAGSGGAVGRPQRRGRTAVLVCGGIHLVVSEQPCSQWHPEMYLALGEEPADARIVQIKSPMGYRAAYEGLYDEIILVDAPGASTPDLASLPWRRVPRPLYPLDEDARWP